MLFGPGSGCERRRPSSDRCGRSARPASTAAAPRNTPQIRDSAQLRGGAAAARPAARQRPRLGVLVSGRVRRRVASRRRPLHARGGEQRIAVDSGGAHKRKRTRHPGSGRLHPASSAPAAAVTSHGGSREGRARPASVAAPPHLAGHLLPVQRDLQPDHWIRAPRAPVPPPSFRSGMRKAGNATDQLSRVGRKGGDGC
jgi:hypothetical protein